MRRSSRPCTTSNPALRPQKTAAMRRTLRAWRSSRGSCTTMSDTSKMRSGSVCLRFSRTDLRRPGRSDVRTIWYSIVLGLASTTASLPGSTRFRNL